MKKILIIYALIFAIFMCTRVSCTVVPHLGKAVGQVPPVFKLNLDLPPEQRWVEIARHYMYPLQTVLGMIEYFLGFTADILFGITSYWAENIYYNKEMIAEIKGVSKGSAIPFGKLVFINFVYEFTTIHMKLCSSILIRNSTGSILHGRNMDFFLWNRFSPLVAQVEFYSKGKYVTTIYSLVGTVFALTGTKPYKFTLTEDTRFLKVGEGSFKNIVENIVLKNYQPSAWLLRQVLIQENSWQSAFERLQKENVSAPIYYIISGNGPNEGAVIEKKTEGVHAVYQLNETNWFLVQSNYDRDEIDPWYDQRRLPIEKRIKELGQNINIQDMYDKVMTKWSTFNIATILTLSSVVSQGYSNITVWYGTTPIKNNDNDLSNMVLG